MEILFHFILNKPDYIAIFYIYAFISLHTEWVAWILLNQEVYFLEERNLL